jgi:hypothetical protein
LVQCKRGGETAASVSDSAEEGCRRGGSHLRDASANNGATCRREEGGDGELGQSSAEALGGLAR